MKPEEITSLMKALAGPIRDYVREAVGKVETKNAELAARLQVVEALLSNSKSMTYRGIFASGTAYNLGDTVTHGGSLWHCNGLTKDRPGDGEAAWTLAVKRGRDGKDVVR